MSCLWLKSMIATSSVVRGRCRNALQISTLTTGDVPKRSTSCPTESAGPLLTEQWEFANQRRTVWTESAISSEITIKLSGKKATWFNCCDSLIT